MHEFNDYLNTDIRLSPYDNDKQYKGNHEECFKV